MRKDDELLFSKDPDLFHELFSHVTLLFNEKYRKFLEEFAAISISYHERYHKILSRIFWFAIETSLCKSKNKQKILGTALLSSSKEITDLFTKDNMLIKPYSILEMIRTPFRADTIQRVAFIFEPEEARSDYNNGDSKVKLVGAHTLNYEPA